MLNIVEKTFHNSNLRKIELMKSTRSCKCQICGKENLSKNEIGLNKKMLNPNAERFYCLECLADFFEVTSDELLAKIEEFKAKGCKLFS